MCLIIAPGADSKPALLPRKVFDYTYSRNNDGFGAMWTEEGRVKHFKTVGLKGDEIYGLMEEYTEKHPDVIFHMRMATHGRVIKNLCHPFRVLHKNRHGHDLFMMHNGVLSSFGRDLNPGQSDTTNFKDKVLVPLLARDPDALDDPDVMGSLNQLTQGNRLIFMRDDGKVWTTQNTSWNDRYGLNLSNTYMLPAYVPQQGASNVSPMYSALGGIYAEPTTGYTVKRTVEYVGAGNQANYRHEVFFKCVKKGVLVSLTGTYYKDQGTGVVIHDVLDKLVGYGETILTPIPSEAMLDDPAFDLDDDSPAEEKEEDGGIAPVDQRLRYARIIHNLFQGKVTSREQMIADLIGMGEQEMSDFLNEDYVSAHIMLEELLEMVLELNDALSEQSLGSHKKVLDVDKIMRLGDMKNHSEAMKNITKIRADTYDTLVKKAADKEKKEKQPTFEEIENNMKDAFERAYPVEVAKKVA